MLLHLLLASKSLCVRPPPIMLPRVRISFFLRLAGPLAVLVLGALQPAGAAESDETTEPLQTIRVEDRIILTVGTSNLGLVEAIVLSPIAVKKETVKPGHTSLAHVLISPLWIKEGDSERPAFIVVRPYINVSHGRVRRFALMRPDGETINRPEQMTPDCRWVLTLEFSHALPQRFTVNVTMGQPTGIEANAELLYTPSNDGQPLRSGPPETFHTVMRVKVEPSLDPWEIRQGDQVLPRADSSSVNLERNVAHRIRFGVERKDPN